MMKTLKFLWQKHRLLLLGFSLTSILTLMFLMKFLVSVIYFANNRNASIEPWMPIGYIARSYSVDRDWLAMQTGLPEANRRPSESIKEAAKAAGISFADMKDRLLTAIEEQRAE